MSRIFDALQRSEAERSGTQFSDTLSQVTDLLQAAEHEVIEQPVVEESPALFPSLCVSPGSDSRLVCLTDTSGLSAEKFRYLGVRLRQLQSGRCLKKLLITSTVSEEGKSMISANLATTLARKKQQRILLLEGDLRRPVLARILGLGELAGLSEWLQGEPGPVSNIYYLEEPGFWFLPAGAPPENPLELMQSGRLSELLDQLPAWFDWIVIDSPPLLPLADTTVWMRLVDGVLLVTRQDTTKRQPLQRGLEMLDRNKLLGVVLNSCTSTEHNDYYSRYSASVQPSVDPNDE